MSETTTRTCDGCGKPIVPAQPYHADGIGLRFRPDGYDFERFGEIPDPLDVHDWDCMLAFVGRMRDP